MPNSNRYLFKYPANVGQPPFDKWIRFDAKAMRHVLRNEMTPEVAAQDITLASAVLYLSETTMQSALESTWNQADLGVLGGAIVQAAATGRTMGDLTPTAMGNFLGGTIEDNLNKLEGIWKSANGDIGAIATTVAAGLGISGGVAMAALADKLIPEFAMHGLEAASGTKINPRTEQLFDSQQYREYNFDFLLVPRTPEEGVAIDNIIQFFQYYMLPKYGQGDTVMGYPYEFEVGIYSSGTTQVGGLVGEDAPTNKPTQLKRVANIGRCIVMNCGVDHAAGSKVSFIRADDNEFFPTATTLSLKLREVALLDRTSPLINREPDLLREAEGR